MPELSHKHRLQPSLFDRLIDDAPHTRDEVREQRGFTEAELRESVRRDLSALFNTTRSEACVDLSRFPEVQSSCVNYGIVDLAGATLSGVDVEKLGHMLRDAVERFEPRLNPRTLVLRPRSARDKQGRNALVFDIEAELYAYPFPIALYLRSEIDLETGNTHVTTLASPEPA